ncbi:MAG TPA: NrsF family protein, partial [Rubrivivax sp.]|nr:NrsF family protein [Rubrivivax sp.]
MKTESLIDMLARQAGPAPRAMAARRLTPAVAGGLLLGVAGALAWIGPIPAELYADPGPWIKFGYAGLLAAAALWWVARLGRPAAPVAAPARVAGGVVVAMLLLGA